MAAPGDPERALVHAVIRDLPGGVLTTDAAGRIVLANLAAARILGAEPDALVGRPLAEIDPELQAMLGTASKSEIELPDPGGGPPRVVGFSSRRIAAEEGSGPSGMVVSFSDITADKALRREQDHARRLADLGQVVASVAHEIRNPVFAITSLAQVLRDEDPVARDPELSIIVDKIREEAVRVSRLVEDLLAFGRERPLSLRDVDVVHEIEGLVADLRDVLPRVEADVPVPVRLRVADELRASPRRETDPDALRSIVMNVVRNARRAVAERVSRKGGDGEVLVSLSTTPRMLVVEVVDDGVGIDPDDLPRIFEAFFSKDPKGTGLGLAIVRKLVDQLAGRITVDSTVGRGTTVRLRLPAPALTPRRATRPPP
jgi:two-component system sensor histidine kinase AtoS